MSAGDCIFCKIVQGEIPSETVYEDERCLAFRDIRPVAPAHILVIPRRHLACLADAGEEERELLGHLLERAACIARAEGLAEGGFRTVINNGAAAGQEVFHLHIHILGGRGFTWPPG